MRALRAFAGIDVMWDLRVPESMAGLPSRRVVGVEECEVRERHRPDPAAYRNRYATEEERREARRRSWREYAARNRGERVEATRRWREGKADQRAARPRR